MHIHRRPGESTEEYARRVYEENPLEPGESPEEYAERLERTTGFPSQQTVNRLEVAAEFGAIVVIGAAGAVAGYFRDLFATAFSRGASTDAMERMDEALAVADLLMLAVAADGRVTDDELAALRAFHARARLEEDADAALEAFVARLPATRDLPAIERLARDAVPRISPAMRREVYRLVFSLARGGSGLAHPGSDRGEGAGGQALCDRFAALLAIDDESRRAIEQRPDKRQAG